jgi:hypothetical protein
VAPQSNFQGHFIHPIQRKQSALSHQLRADC